MYIGNLRTTLDLLSTFTLSLKTVNIVAVKILQILSSMARICIGEKTARFWVEFLTAFVKTREFKEF